MNLGADKPFLDTKPCVGKVDGQLAPCPKQQTKSTFRKKNQKGVDPKLHGLNCKQRAIQTIPMSATKHFSVKDRSPASRTCQ